MNLRYHSRKLLKRLQRMTTWVGFGCFMIFASHWVPNDGEREWCRDTGTAIAGFAFARHVAQQGKRRLKPNGEPVRTPTLRIQKRDVDEIQRRIWGGN